MSDFAFSSRFAEALALAEHPHRGQTRKGTDIPYIAHPLAVAGLVIDFGGDEDQAIAGLLHDVIEDAGEAFADIIGQHFGVRVRELVGACTDGTAEAKAVPDSLGRKREDWQRRKDAYIERLASESEDALLIAACDKLHNARAIVSDLERHGAKIFERFTTGRAGTLWYYERVADTLLKRQARPAAPLAVEVVRMQVLAGASPNKDPVVEHLMARLDGTGRELLRTIIGSLDARAQHALTVASRSVTELSAQRQALLTLRMQVDGHE